MERCCETCKYFWEDRSTNASDCENTEINEDELDKYYCDGEEGCPHWVARYTEEKIAAEEEYLRKLCEDEENMRRHYEEIRREEQQVLERLLARDEKRFYEQILEEVEK